MSVITTDMILEKMNIPGSNYTDVFRAFRKHHTIPEHSKILIVGTKATIESRAYQQHLESTGYSVYEYIPHKLAQAIEESATREELYSIIEPSITYALLVGATHILFACTHYPLAKDVFEECASNHSWHGEFVDPGVYVAKEVALWNIDGESRCEYRTSKETDAFNRFKPTID
jgi:glutamate racemase